MKSDSRITILTLLPPCARQRKSGVIPIGADCPKQFGEGADFLLKTEMADRGKGIDEYRQSGKRKTVRIVPCAAVGIVAAAFRTIFQRRRKERRGIDPAPWAAADANPVAQSENRLLLIRHDQLINPLEIFGAVRLAEFDADFRFRFRIVVYGEIQNAGEIEIAVRSLRMLTALDDDFPAAACDVAAGILKTFPRLALRGNQHVVVQE